MIPLLGGAVVLAVQTLNVVGLGTAAGIGLHTGSAPARRFALFRTVLKTRSLTPSSRETGRGSFLSLF